VGISGGHSLRMEPVRFGVETDGFCGAAVTHGSGQDQVSKGHFLVGDGIGDWVFRHRESSFLGLLEIGDGICLLRSLSHRERAAAGRLSLVRLFCDRDRMRHRIA
jgi:hypothetical protein